MTRTATASAACMLVLGLFGCDACRNRDQPTDPPLATVYELRGNNARRDYDRSREHWEPVDARAQFRLGDGLRTDPPSSAVLDLADGAQLQVRTGTIIRFLVDGSGSGEQAFDLIAGEALLSAGPKELRLRTHVGLAVLAANTRVQLTRAGADMRLRVDVGQASLRDPRGKLETLGPGTDVVLEVGMAVLRTASDAGSPVADAGSSTGEKDAGTADVAAANSDEAEIMHSPERANLDVAAGESFVLHAPEVPVALGFDVTRKCKAEAVIELAQSRQRWRGAGHINVSWAAGSKAYALRCIDARGGAGKVVSRGVVQVLRDAGTRKLPPRAPTSEIDADGRSYTIFYQNQLPNVHVRWPNAPVAKSYQLLVDGAPMSVPAAEHLFQSGSLRDGTHQVSFGAESRRSRTAEISVRFDNTTATASLSSPSDHGFSPGDSVTIEGVALPAWKVSLTGGTIENVADDRFRGQVVTSSDHPDIAVRLVHPRLGTHYYLRRAAGSQ